MTSDFKIIFAQLKGMLQKYAKGAVAGGTTLIDSTAKEKKDMYGLIGKKKVAIGNRKPQPTYVAGIIQQKHFVGFYSMPMYSHPKQMTPAHPMLKKMRKGKSCINVNKLDAEMLRELDMHVKKGIALYKKEGWI